jgi:GTP cyclohydrolase III
MDAITTASLGARRNEDIALDLLKFVSLTAGVGRAATPSTGFSGAAVPKPEEQVSQLLELYSRCLKAVEGQGPEQAGQALGQAEQAQELEQPVQALVQADQAPQPQSSAQESPYIVPQGWVPQP